MSLRAVKSALSPAAGKLTIAYLLVATAANLMWEVIQLPLYTIWRTATAQELAYAVLHCTLGDLLVLSTTFLLGLLLVAGPQWPLRSIGRVALAVTLLGAGYTTYSEWRNVEVLRNWSYAASMPLLPLFGTGLAPFTQWLVVPPLSLFTARRFCG
ncbi:uncharacterized protein E1O_05060 [Burkholderiales bacterium GJ-E10]|nr:uncharacterized protein E1O_05060 [Burkholderiales bacterium GJ-E10]